MVSKLMPTPYNHNKHQPPLQPNRLYMQYINFQQAIQRSYNSHNLIINGNGLGKLKTSHSREVP